MKKTLFIWLVFNLIVTSLTAQNIIKKAEQPAKSGGQVKIVEDQSILKAVDNHQWFQSQHQSITGFRIRIFSDSGPNAKNQFELTKAGFQELFNLRLYEEFQYPFYKIYVGDFRSRSEAMKNLIVIEKSFPDAFIVQTKINYPKLGVE